MLYVWIFGSLLSIIVGFCLAEICAKLPNAGSVYVWAGELAPIKNAPLASYSAGWMNFLGNAASSVGYSFGFGQFVASVYDIYHPDNTLSLGYQVLIAMMGTVLMAIVNILRIDIQSHLNIVNLVFSVGSLIVLCVLLMIADSPRQSIHWAFSETFNQSGFSNFGYVVLTGTLTLLFGVAGYEASAHLAEETNNPRVAAPLGMVFNIITTCVFGFIYLLILVINTPSDIGNLLNNTVYDNPSIQIFVNCAGVHGAAGMTSLIVIMGFMAGLANMTITARVGWAMARDGAFPYSDRLKYINPKTKSPTNIILLLLVIDFILLLIPLGSPLAFAAITSISTVGYQVSYAIPIALRLASKVWVPDTNFSLGMFSVPLNILSIIFLVVTGTFMLFPTANPITVDTMNWALPVTPAFALFGAFFWVCYSRHTFKGPVLTMDLKPSSTDNPEAIKDDALHPL